MSRLSVIPASRQAQQEGLLFQDLQGPQQLPPTEFSYILCALHIIKMNLCRPRGNPKP